MRAAIISLIFLFSLLGSCLPFSEARPSPQATATFPAGQATAPTTQPAPSPGVRQPRFGLDEIAFLEKTDPDSIRVMSYNVNWDSIFPEDDPENHEFRSADRVQAFRRILSAVQPDIICLQEINPRRSPDKVSEILEAVLAESGYSAWESAGARDSVIASHFGLVHPGYELVAPAFPLDLDQAGALIDLPDSAYGPQDLYLVCAHFKSGGGEDDIQMRQRQADVIASHVRDATSAGGELDLPQNTPILLAGDFNVYDTDPAHHLVTLITGDIEGEERYGADAPPDWDQTGLADALPNHNAREGETYTWRDDSGGFAPGALDRILYSDSVFRLVNAFVLNTTLLSDDGLAAAGLFKDDVLIDPVAGYFDHLPLVVDFALRRD